MSVTTLLLCWSCSMFDIFSYNHSYDASSSRIPSLCWILLPSMQVLINNYFQFNYSRIVEILQWQWAVCNTGKGIDEALLGYFGLTWPRVVETGKLWKEYISSFWITNLTILCWAKCKTWTPSILQAWRKRITVLLGIETGTSISIELRLQSRKTMQHFNKDTSTYRN
jgi:hypothetical protein